MRQLTEDEMVAYLDSISNSLFNKQYSELNFGLKATLKLNLLMRKRYNEIDDTSYNQLIAKIDGRMVLDSETKKQIEELVESKREMCILASEMH